MRGLAQITESRRLQERTTFSAMSVAHVSARDARLNARLSPPIASVSSFPPATESFRVLSGTAPSTMSLRRSASLVAINEAEKLAAEENAVHSGTVSSTMSLLRSDSLEERDRLSDFLFKVTVQIRARIRVLIFHAR